MSALASGIDGQPAPAVDALESLDPSLERTFRGHKGKINSVVFKPNMQQLASGSDDGSVMVWNFRPQLRAFRFLGHKGAVNGVSFSPSGRLLASASSDRTVRLWIPNVQGKSAVIKGHASTVRSVNFSRNGKRLLTASDDKTLKIWALPSRKFVGSFTGHSNWVRDARFSPTASPSPLQVMTRRYASGMRQAAPASTPTTTIRQPSTQSRSRTLDCLASCSDDGTVKIWDTRSNQLVQHYASTTACAVDRFHPSETTSCRPPATTHSKFSICVKVICSTLQGHTRGCQLCRLCA